MPTPFRSLPFLLALLVFLLPYPEVARAVQVAGLYQAEVPVAGQSAEQRNQAIRAAFAQVLVKVSGRPGIAARKELAAALGNAARYVQQYSYLDAPPPGSGAAQGKAGEWEPPRLLQVSFDGRAVDSLLRGLNLPVWGPNRPSILVWIASQKGGKRRLLALEEDEPVRNALAQAAAERGLPLLFPLMDLEDRGRLQVADLWGGFEANIREASRRYNPDLILTGRLSRVSRTLWRGEWTLYQRDQMVSWSNEAKSDAGLAAAAVRHVADLLASRFVPAAAGDATWLRLRVEGVDDLARYVALRNLLESQGTIRQVALDSVAPEAVVYRLQAQGSLQSLEQELELGGLIEPLPAAGEAPVPAGRDRRPDLHYRMRR